MKNGNWIHDSPANIYITGITLLLDVYPIITTNPFYITLHVVAMKTYFCDIHNGVAFGWMGA